MKLKPGRMAMLLSVGATCLMLTACRTTRKTAEYWPAPERQTASEPAPVVPVSLPRFRYYGVAGGDYSLHVCTNLVQPEWQEVWRGVMPEMMQTNLPDLNIELPRSSTIFIRHQKNQ